jgi:hypothetical protein
LAVYTGTGVPEDDCPVDASAQWIAVNDDWAGGQGECGNGSRVHINMEASGLYLIRIGGEDGSEPAGTLTIAHHPDCNENSIPDPCDLSCGVAGGSCDMTGCGQSSDANENGLPDECESCPAGATVAFVSPPAGFFDARQPHPVDDSGALQGVGTFTVSLSDSGCCFAELWSCVETQDNPDLHPGVPLNDISGAVGGETCVVTLNHPITHGEVTTLTHAVCGPGGAFTFYPGDVDQSGGATLGDIDALIDSLNGVAPLPDEQADINRDGHQGPGDILRLIDLFNGAGEYEPWLTSP